VISIVTWLWNTGFREYRPEYVNVMYYMVARNLPCDFRFVCVTNETYGFDPRIEVMAIPKEAAALARLESPEGKRVPSCYQRLWMFSEAARVCGDRVLLLDIDLVIKGDISALVTSPHDFVGWRPTMEWGNKDRLAGGAYLLTTGSYTGVWTEFVDDPLVSQKRARDAGYRGSDQAWISFYLAEHAHCWPHGLMASVNDFEIKQKVPYGKYVPQPQNHQFCNPSDAPVIQFNGPKKPWMLLDVPWISEHWQ
jgi:hypothetical protein